MELKLLTLNLHAWLEENQEEKFQIIADYIYKNDIDIEIESYENKGSIFTYTFMRDKKKLLDGVDSEEEKGEE